MPDSTAISTSIIDRETPRVALGEDVRRANVLTFSVEDYFQASALRKVVDERHWDRFESRLDRSLKTALDLLDAHGSTATFFVFGWTAERLPELIREISDRGHEVACHGYDARPVTALSADELRENLRAARSSLENATGQRVHGHRIGSGRLRTGDDEVLDVVAELEFLYDSSLLAPTWPFGSSRSGFVHERTTKVGPLTEVPLADLHAKLVRRGEGPIVANLRTWELDREQPRITALGPLARRRHERRLANTRARLVDLLQRDRFSSVAEVLGLERVRLESSPVRASGTRTDWHPNVPTPGPVGSRERTAVSIVVPCFNEERSIPYLARTLESVRFELADAYDPEFVFVDDCSTDTTVEVLEATFAGDSNVRVVRHETNKGVAAAILTGIEAARHDVVASMDCDCSYDPHELRRMLPLLTDGVDLVTASPYHPRGTVENVPGWRLFLSRGLSALYARVLPVKLHTYTSCFRVHRRERFAGMTLEHDGFLGVAEMLAHAAQLAAGRREQATNTACIVEYPTTLSVRLFGESKMKTLRCIRGHLGLLARYAFQRRPLAPTATDGIEDATPVDAQPLPHGRG